MPTYAVEAVHISACQLASPSEKNFATVTELLVRGGGEGAGATVRLWESLFVG
jgi:hypothetical protein